VEEIGRMLGCRHEPLESELMLGLFKRRKQRFMEGLMQAKEAESRAKVNRALGSVGVQLAPEPDNIQYCIKASSAIVRVITQKADAPSVGLMNEDDKFVAGIFCLVASSYVSGVVGAQFEMVSSTAAIDLLGLDYADRVSDLGESYSSMSQNGRVIEAIGQNIAKWIASPTDDRLDKLAKLYKLCREHAE
jgi:hypothetical protein